MFSVIIPSRNIANLVPCVDAVRRCEPDAQIIVVDDFDEDPADEFGGCGYCWTDEEYEKGVPVRGGGCGYCMSDKQYTGRTVALGYRVDWVDGVKPFVFARNINLGINAAGDDDVVILGDDGLLQTPGGFSLLAREAEEHPEFGIVSSTVNNVGNLNQLPKGIGLREDPRIVCFVAVYIPRRTIETVGLLDERFTGYGFDDDDFCLRIRRAGLKIGIHDGCFVDHNSLRSTFRGNPSAPANLVDGRAIFVEKWGAHPL